MPLTLSPATLSTAGVLLLTVVAVESGGYYMLAIVRGRVARTPFQVSFARAGHAHAGVLVILSLVAQLYVDASGMGDPFATLARDGIPLAAILMPAGFFLASAGAGQMQPNRWIWSLYVGTASLAIGVVALGIGLLVAA
jgi:hypothetical protein